MTPHDLADRSDQTLRVAGRADDDPQRSGTALEDGNVHGLIGVHSGIGQARIANHTDDFVGHLSWRRTEGVDQEHRPAHRIPPRVQPPGQRLTEHGNERCAIAIGVRDVPSLHERHAHRSEVAGRHSPAERRLTLILCSQRTVGSADFPAIHRIPDRQGRRARGRKDARQRTDLVENRGEERMAAGTFRVGRSLDLDSRCQRPFGRESQIHCGEPEEAAHEQPRSNEQHDRDRDLGNDQPAAQPRAANSLAHLPPDSKVRYQARGGAADSRNHADQEPRGYRGGDGEGQHQPVHHWLDDAESVQREQVQQQTLEDVGHGDAKQPGGQREHDALGQALPDQAPPGRAQRRPHGGFRQSALPPRQQQPGHVGAGDEQQAGGRRGWEQEPRPYASAEVLLQADEPEALAFVAVGIGTLEHT